MTNGFWIDCNGPDDMLYIDDIGLGCIPIKDKFGGIIVLVTSDDECFGFDLRIAQSIVAMLNEPPKFRDNSAG
jgi:hypothetical protein